MQLIWKVKMIPKKNYATILDSRHSAKASMIFFVKSGFFIRLQEHIKNM